MKKFNFFSVLLSAALLSGVTASTAVSAADQFVTIGTGGVTGVYYPTGGSICRLVNKDRASHGVRCTVESTGGSVYNINTIRAGELDLGVAQSDWQFHASNGSSKWQGKKQSDLRAVMSVHPEPFHIIVGKDSGINSWADLTGKRVNIGNPGSGQRGTMEVLMAAHGTKASDFKIATELTSSEQSKALCDGKIDAYGYTVGVPNAGVSIATDGCDARIINLNSDVEASLVNDNPYYAFATIPAGTYNGNPEDTVTFGVGATVVSSAVVSDHVIHSIVKGVFENFDSFKKLHPAFANLKKEEMIQDGLSAPLHDGAARYYKEVGLMNW